MALKINDENAKELIASGKPVVIDFWAEWCGPCRAIAPSVDELAEEYEGKVIIGKYNVDDDADLSAEYSIRNIPTLLFFKEGKLVDKHVGSASKAENQSAAVKIRKENRINPSLCIHIGEGFLCLEIENSSLPVKILFQSIYIGFESLPSFFGYLARCPCFLPDKFFPDPNIFGCR